MNISVDEFRSSLVKDFIIEANGIDTPRNPGDMHVY